MAGVEGGATGNAFTVLASGPIFTLVGTPTNTVTPSGSNGTAYATGVITFKSKS